MNEMWILATMLGLLSPIRSLIGAFIVRYPHCPALPSLLSSYRSLCQRVGGAMAWLLVCSSCCLGEIVVKISDVFVDRSQLQNTILIPIFAISDDPELKLSGFNWNFDIGGDGQGPLPLGVTLPAPLPDSNSIIATGGEVNAQNWFLITVAASNGGLTQSDLLITGNSPAFQTDIAIFGNPSALTGGTLLFNLALRLDHAVADRVEITMPSELEVLPFTTDSFGNALQVTFLPGSITLTAVPEPGSGLLVLGAVGGWVIRKRRRCRRGRGKPSPA